MGNTHLVLDTLTHALNSWSHQKQPLQKLYFFVMTQHFSKVSYEQGSENKAGRRNEWRMKENSTNPPTTSALNVFDLWVCVVFKPFTAIMRGGEKNSNRTRDTEWGRSQQESQSLNPPGNAAKGNLLALTMWLCACVSVCVWPLTSDSVWPLCWQAPVKGVPVWAEHSQTTWESAWTTMYVCTANVILNIRGNVWLS